MWRVMDATAAERFAKQKQEELQVGETAYRDARVMLERLDGSLAEATRAMQEEPPQDNLPAPAAVYRTQVKRPFRAKFRVSTVVDKENTATGEAGVVFMVREQH